MLVAALNYSNSLALLLAFLLAGFALVAMHECHRNLLGLSLLEAAAPPLFAGSIGTLRLTLQNASRLARYRVETAVPDEPAAPLDLTAGGRGQVELSIRAADARLAAHRPAAGQQLASLRPVPGLDLGARAHRRDRLSAGRGLIAPAD